MSAAGQGYFVSPEKGAGPGVLLLHSFWGLNRQTKDTANRLADAGFTVLAPDLFDGVVYDDEDDAIDALGTADMNLSASLVQASLGILRRAQRNATAPVGVVGFGPGASWALWLSARLTDEVGAVVTYYGSQSIPMDGSRAEYLAHWADTDSMVSDLEVADLGLSLQMAGVEFRFEYHENTTDGFAEAGLVSFDPEAEVVAWRQTTEFLASTLRPFQA